MPHAFPVTALGGLLAGWLLPRTDAPTFESLVPWLILAASLLLAVESGLKAGHIDNDIALAVMVFIGGEFGGRFASSFFQQK